ncbi:regulator of G-protein signaling 20 isoform X1 [Zonotrichia leucophrys gambelii]|uniref:regulator of G-protein signaling 20 isoform X1 n=1 Tax=Zonotrichia leucophrys gambelii TaxID=257770 RepID=UPI00314088EA
MFQRRVDKPGSPLRHLLAQKHQHRAPRRHRRLSKPFPLPPIGAHTQTRTHTPRSHALTPFSPAFLPAAPVPWLPPRPPQPAAAVRALLPCLILLQTGPEPEQPPAFASPGAIRRQPTPSGRAVPCRAEAGRGARAAGLAPCGSGHGERTHPRPHREEPAGPGACVGPASRRSRWPSPPGPEGKRGRTPGRAPLPTPPWDRRGRRSANGRWRRPRRAQGLHRLSSALGTEAPMPAAFAGAAAAAAHVLLLEIKKKREQGEHLMNSKQRVFQTVKKALLPLLKK